MSRVVPLRGPSERRILRCATPPASEVRALRARAWQEQGLATLDPAEIRDPIVRAAVVAEAERQFGRRTRR